MILGATGATGKHLLKELISSSHFTKVGEYGRRVTPQSQIPATNKLEQKVIDFEAIDRTAFRDDRWDVIFITYVQCSVSHLFRGTGLNLLQGSGPLVETQEVRPRLKKLTESAQWSTPS